MSKWEEWISEGEVELTRGGRRRRASYAEVARWVNDVWKALDRQLLQQAFVSCGITGERQPALHQRLHALVHEGQLPGDAEIVEISDSDETDSDE